MEAIVARARQAGVRRAAARHSFDTLRSVTDLDWTMLSPSALFVEGERTGKFRLGGNGLLTAEDGKSWITYQDFSIAFMFLLSISGCNLIGYAQTKQGSNMNSNTLITYRTVDVNGLKIFYREAGDPTTPTILLLHGFPMSHMYRDPIPKLADQFHLVAPDYPGSGNSDYPSEAQFKPTFANLADVMANFVTTVGLKRFVVYMQDFGGPVGFRLAVM
jgi:hypothetical protein